MGPTPAQGRTRQLPASGRSRGGFSLIELLCSIGIILILATIYWGPNTASRQRQLKARCQANLQQVSIALQLYANEHAGKFPASTGARTAEEALDVLVPRYTADTAAFICPGSKDAALPPAESFRKRKISYAYYMGRSLTNTQVLMTDKQVDAQPKTAGQAAFSTDGKPPGNNHARFGGNLLFSDGHLEESRARLSSPLELGPGEVLLNP